MTSSTKCFIAGVIFNSATLSLWIDYLKKDGSIDYVASATWIPSVVSVPIAFLLLIAAVVIYSNEKKEERSIKNFFAKFSSLGPKQ